MRTVQRPTPPPLPWVMALGLMSAYPADSTTRPEALHSGQEPQEEDENRLLPKLTV